MTQIDTDLDYAEILSVRCVYSYNWRRRRCGVLKTVEATKFWPVKPASVLEGSVMWLSAKGQECSQPICSEVTGLSICIYTCGFMKLAYSGDVDLVFVLNGVGRGRDSIVLSCMWQGGAFTNLSRVERGGIS